MKALSWEKRKDGLGSWLFEFLTLISEKIPRFTDVQAAEVQITANAVFCFVQKPPAQ